MVFLLKIGKKLNFYQLNFYQLNSTFKMQGRFLWNCYKASCPAKGIKDDKLSLSSIKK